ncbi:MAG: hypothetical protein WD669_13460 [Pirellulales bacterium]
MFTLLHRIAAAARPIAKSPRLTLYCLAIGCVLGAGVGCSPPETGKPTLPDPDSVPPPSGGRMVADPSKLERVPIVKD